MNILITNHSIMYNRGSEAVIRSITRICRFWRPDSFITVSTGEEGEILKDVADADQTVPRYDSAGRIDPLLSAAKQADIVLVTGADNYDSLYGNPAMEEVNRKLSDETKAKMILYDCSLHENNFVENTFRDFTRFSYVTARESITYEMLLKRFPLDKIGLYPDPAFVMPVEKCNMPSGFAEGQMVGINISNLILTGRFGADRETILDSYHRLMDFILKKTKYKIILIQHIVNNGYDLDALEKIYSWYKEDDRVILMKTELLNAMQIKYVISKLRILVTARTHASIAAYSTCVPTLVVSYSVKSMGIAKDLFEDINPFVLPLCEMEDKDELRRKFEFIMEHDSEIRKYLHRIIPKYKLQALKFGEIL